MEGKDKNNQDEYRQDEVFSKAVRAGKRTYFFDVKATRAEDYYLTITESKRKFNNDNQKFYFIRSHGIISCLNAGFSTENYGTSRS